MKNLKIPAAVFRLNKQKGNHRGGESINRQEYLAELFDRYGNLVWSICYKFTNDYFEAQDLTQDTFLAVYNHLPSFDGRNERAWICRIAANKGLDYVKQAQKRIQPEEDIFFSLLENGQKSTEEEILEKDTKKRLYEACCSLKPPYNEVAVDYFCKEMTTAEIAAARKKKEKTVQTQIYRAKAMLKKIWKEA